MAESLCKIPEAAQHPLAEMHLFPMTLISCVKLQAETLTESLRTTLEPLETKDRTSEGFSMRLHHSCVGGEDSTPGPKSCPGH